jgi:hypothetical protein
MTMYIHIYFHLLSCSPVTWYSFVICTLILEHVKKQKSWVVGNLKYEQPCKIQNFVSIFGKTSKYYNEICNSVSILNKIPHGNAFSIAQSKPQGLGKALSQVTHYFNTSILRSTALQHCIRLWQVDTNTPEEHNASIFWVVPLKCVYRHMPKNYTVTIHSNTKDSPQL